MWDWLSDAESWAGGLSRAAGGAGTGMMLGGGPASPAGWWGALGGGLLGGAAGMYGGYAQAQEKDRIRDELAARAAMREQMAQALMAQAHSGSQAMGRAGRQRIQQGYEGASRGALWNAAGRGLLHSGAAHSAAQDLSRRRDEAHTALEGAQQQYLNDALARAASIRLGGMDNIQMQMALQGDPWGGAIQSLGQMAQAYGQQNMAQQYLDAYKGRGTGARQQQFNVPDYASQLGRQYG